MVNEAAIHESSFEVTLTASIRTPLYLKIILVTFFCVLLSLVLFMISSFERNEVKAILGFSCIAATILFFTGKYIAWNLYGREWIKVTTKSILYSRHYGLYGLPPKVIAFDYMATNIEMVKEHEAIAYGIIHFYDRVLTTMQLRQQFSSGINIPVTQLKVFEEKIHQLFTKDQTGFAKWLEYSKN